MTNAWPCRSSQRLPKNGSRRLSWSGFSSGQTTTPAVFSGATEFKCLAVPIKLAPAEKRKSSSVLERLFIRTDDDACRFFGSDLVKPAALHR